jgi:hypothetical protein
MPSSLASPVSQPYLLLLKDDTDGDMTVIEIVFEQRWKMTKSGKGSCISSSSEGSSTVK